ncbi:MAG: leucine-rich repeat protein [Mycoplasma sp.]|nr:leucine-rich repeat protein [Candidatus Hennigella equi]
MKKNWLKWCLAPIIITPTMVLPMASCSLVNNLIKRARQIDGTDWIGRSTGMFENEDDYQVNEQDKTVTYWNMDELKAHDLVVPNYVLWKGEKYKVLLDHSAFKNCGNLISGTIELNDFCTSIPNSFFKNDNKITTVILHNYPEEIGQFAFLNCSALENIFVRNGSKLDPYWALKTKAIKASAFDSCSLSGKLLLGPELTELGPRAFINCWRLTNVDLSLATSLTEIGESAFASCGELEQVTLSTGLNYEYWFTPDPTVKGFIHDSAFANCFSLKTVILPEQDMTLHLGNYVFSQCDSFRGFTYRGLPTPLRLTIAHAGRGCFANCISLEKKDYLNIFYDYIESAYLPSVFEGCAFTSWKFDPNLVDSLGDYAFAFNQNLTLLDFTSISLGAHVPDYWNWEWLNVDPVEDVFAYGNKFGVIKVRSGFVGSSTFSEWVNWFENQGLTFKPTDYTTPSLDNWSFSEV